jgi:enoyl-CoA hydratase/carnithine racemase
LHPAAFDDQIQTVILTGEGDYFCGGVDFSDFFRRFPDADHPIAELFRAFIHFPKICIAAINGHVTGLGLTLALYCDFILAITGAEMSDDSLENGLCPLGGTNYLLEKTFGKSRANAMLQAGESIFVDALKDNLYALADSPDDLQRKTALLAEQLAKQPAHALKQAKKIRQSAEKEELIRYAAEEERRFLALIASPETQQLLTARYGFLPIYQETNAMPIAGKNPIFPQTAPTLPPNFTVPINPVRPDADMSAPSVRARLMERRKNRLAARGEEPSSS